jgi:hypothetical protein
MTAWRSSSKRTGTVETGSYCNGPRAEEQKTDSRSTWRSPLPGGSLTRLIRDGIMRFTGSDGFLALSEQIVEVFPFLLIIVVLAIVFRLGAGGMDRGRIEEYIRERGGRIVSINWAPFGKGWFGEKNARIYEVMYYDRDGDLHMATCKTSLLSGVYWTEDRIAHRRAAWEDRLPDYDARGEPLIHSIDDPEPRRAPDDELARLREENARLRAEIERRDRS